ncbi:S8/S53 family peptidase [Bradyrhizobium sp. 149]|uniref:S8/S53 family peptidase n=1 Tax=Bradyrhizobium sp. 149 TaxID=2782624 RepID=UPI001FFB54CE|nr:S8/S53 family peptidase [Bradyrhizobium sp. 149]MCK1652977.1 S8/S53 family peptidase [Bradyrhizobium sp. 149]
MTGSFPKAPTILNIASALFVASTLLSAPCALAQSPPVNLLIQTKKLTPELVVAVAKWGQEKSIPAKAGTDVIQLVSQQCGTANARRYYLPVFLSANASNPEIKSGKLVLTKEATLVFPACLYANEKLALVPVSETGVDWTKPTPVQSSTLQEVLRTYQESAKSKPQSTKSKPSAPNKWIPILGSSTGFIFDPVENSDASTWGAQTIDYDFLVKGKPTAKAAPNTGPILVARTDSDHLANNSINDQYQKVLKDALKYDVSTVEPRLVQGSAGLEKMLRAQDVLDFNDIKGFKNIPTGASLVTSDFAPGAYPITLKEGSDVKVAAREIFTSAPRSTAAIGQLNNISPYFAEPLGGDDKECKPGPSDTWPVNLEELQTVLRLRKAIGAMPSTGLLLVLDTGFPRGQVDTAPFTKMFFYPSPQDDDPAREPYLWSVTRPPEYFNDNSENASHGVGVLALALGGLGVLKQNMLASNVETQGKLILDLMAYQRLAGNKLGVAAEAVTRSLSGTGWGRADILTVNLSLKFDLENLEEAPDFNGYLALQNQVLFVLAAGNDGEDAANVVPARWGGVANKNVITVGAIGADNNFWKKSNKSSAFVDIAAPGCAVPTTYWNPSTKKFDEVVLSGTSFAAPLVSFTSNLLREYASGARRKARILASGRYFPDLQTVTRSSRALDIPTALATPFDVVRTSAGKLRFGRVKWLPGKTLCGTPFTQGTFAQVHRMSDQQDKVSVVKKQGALASGALDLKTCDLANGQLDAIPFEEAQLGDNGLSYAPAEPIDIRSVESITFCESCEFRPQ